jgi:hypothetical protein
MTREERERREFFKYLKILQQLITVTKTLSSSSIFFFFFLIPTQLKRLGGKEVTVKKTLNLHLQKITFSLSLCHKYKNKTLNFRFSS